MVKQQISTLMQKEMTRKEFLGTMGFGLASLFGLSTVLRLLNGGSVTNRSGRGYGSSTYGGGKD